MVGSTCSASNVHEVIDDNCNSYRTRTMDVLRMNQGHVGQCPIIDEEFNADATKFFDLLKDSDEPLWDSCTNHSKLSVVSTMFTSSRICKPPDKIHDINMENFYKFGVKIFRKVF